MASLRTQESGSALFSCSSAASRFSGAFRRARDGLGWTAKNANGLTVAVAQRRNDPSTDFASSFPSTFIETILQPLLQTPPSEPIEAFSGVKGRYGEDPIQVGSGNKPATFSRHPLRNERR